MVWNKDCVYNIFIFIYNTINGNNNVYRIYYIYRRIKGVINGRSTATFLNTLCGIDYIQQ